MIGFIALFADFTCLVRARIYFKECRISSQTVITSSSDSVKAEGSHIAWGICFALLGNWSQGIR